MIEVGSQKFNPVSFITRVGDVKPIIILPKEDYVLYLTPVDSNDLTTKEILALRGTPEGLLSLLRPDNKLEALIMA